jgi:tetratricopeptide (TPR) repeat protein
MYTDVVGYSKLTGDNQEIALIILEEHNKILDRFTKRYSGNIVKLTGDGLCALFDSPISAIKSAIEIQRALDKRNRLNVEERQIQIRIGIHYGTYINKDDDVFGEGVNLAKSIEPIAPHGGIAISSEINDMVWDTNDIYIREHVILDFNGEKVQTYEVYLDLIDWFNNKKNKATQIVDNNQIYKKAHSLFHQGNYSSAIKFAILSLKDSDKKFEILSFICHTFICLGELHSSEKILIQIEEYFDSDSSNPSDEDIAHLYKMKGNLQLNLDNLKDSFNYFKKSLDMMLLAKSEYINEIIYNISTVLLMDNKQNLINDYIKFKKENTSDYTVLITGLSLFLNENKNDVDIQNFIKVISDMENHHLQALAYRIVAIIYFDLKEHDNSQINISQSQDLLLKSSKNISDDLQRDKFIDNVLIHKDIMSFSDKISDYFLNIAIDDIKSNDNDDNQEESGKYYSFCTNCGNENKDEYKFCVNCGCNLVI